MLTNENIQELHTLADSRDRVEWRIGEIAAEAWERNLREGAGLLRFQVFTAVAREARCSKGRVEKLYNMVKFYPKEVRQEYPGYKLGHYEVAMNFGPEEAKDVLDYVHTYVQDTGNLPKVNSLDFLYRREVLGQETEKEIKEQPRRVAYNPNLLQDRIMSLIVSIRSLVQGKPLSDDARGKLDQGLTLIQEALIDTEEVIHYN